MKTFIIIFFVYLLLKKFLSTTPRRKKKAEIEAERLAWAGLGLIVSVVLSVIFFITIFKNPDYSLHLTISLISAVVFGIFLYMTYKDIHPFKNGRMRLKKGTKPHYFVSDGIGYERYCKFCLENLEGFHGVKMTKTSGDFGADLIARKGKETYCIQCKNYDSSVSPRAVQEVVASLRMYGGDKAMVITNSRLTPEAKQIAKANGVIVWEHYGIEDRI